jgi:crossover junction endodeoxyribonuclease RuvC
MPAQGITSAFNFGFTTGVLHGALAGNQIPMVLVPPSVWKRAYGLIGQDKDASRLAASRLAPAFAQHWPLKKHDGRAEAFLLAHYGSQL